MLALIKLIPNVPVLLVYDSTLTFADEVELIWPAPATYAKYIFLLNRYTVLGTLFAVAYGMSFCI